MDNWIIKQKIDFARPVSSHGAPEVLMLPGDNLAHTWQVACLKNDIPVDLSGASVTAYFLRVDGNAVMITGEVSGNIASVTLTQECYAFAGGLRGVMRITDSETEAVVSMAEHAFVVRPAVDAGGIIDPGEVIPSIDELIAKIDEMEEATAAAEAAATKSVRYDSAQTLTDAQKEQARGNIDAAGEDDVADLESAIANKIDEPATEGTAGQALVTDGNGGRSWASISVAVDDTLTQAGEAADAKAVGDIFDDITAVSVSRNLYNSTACSPANNYYYTSSGAYSSSTNWATSGKIPVDASTQYIFSAGGARIKAARYFKGTSGETFISGENVDDGPFTTPAECTYVALNIFAAAHTDAAYTAAIAVAQLEKGNTATEYVPYGTTRNVPLSAVEDGDAIVKLSNGVTASDVGKVAKIKTVSGGVVTAWELGSTDDVVRTRNLYNSADCNPANGYRYDNYGTYTSGDYWATSGKIPVEASTQYIFSAGGVRVKSVRYFSGDDGATYLSGEDIDDAAFTTPATCTYIALNLFAAGHTATEYAYAIAHAQLEEGSVATDYVPYYISVGDKLDELYADVHGKNMYNTSSVTAQDGYYYNASGEVTASSNYGITGIIPCSDGCTYIFSAGDATVKIVAYFYDGSFISRETIDGAAFTTPAKCNGVGFNLFAVSHTTEEFNAAIAAAQLEAGDRVTSYEAYDSNAEQGYSFIAQGIGINRTKAISQKAITDLLAYPRRTTWWNGKKGDSLGDSITYKFDYFQTYVKNYLGLSEFYNNGMTGTKMSGPTDTTWGDSMWMDSRINALHDDAEFITILGGANDSSAVQMGTVDLTNCDTNTYAGAFNVVISKIYYRYLALESGYYQDIDYSGVQQLSTPHNILLFPCTMFYVPGGIANLDAKAEVIRTLSAAWGLRVVDFRSTIQANPGVADLYWTESDRIHPISQFYQERLAPVLVSALTQFQPLEYTV